MAITVAIQEGSSVVVKDENNNALFRKSGQLHGYTGTTVSVKESSGSIVTYNEKGREVSRN
jgi:protein required for attachment to host cells